VAHQNTVIWSVNLDGDTICVDVFRRSDGSFGFDEFRRDPEDGRGWFSIGHHSDRRFDDFDAAQAAACRDVGWLEDALRTDGGV